METVRVGRIVGAHGLKGEVKVAVLTDFVERLDVGRRLRLRGHWVEVLGARSQSHRLLLRLEGVENIDAAKALYGEYLDAPADVRPELGEGEYVSADLIGMMVVTVAGEGLGEVQDVMLLPAHDVLVVGDVMIPAVRQFVKSVELDARRIVVELIEGMR